MTSRLKTLLDTHTADTTPEPEFTRSALNSMRPLPPETEPKDTPEFNTGQDIFALPVIEFTDTHFDAIIQHDLTPLETAFLCYLLGNCDTQSGSIHKKRPTEIAAQLNCHVSTFYGERGLIERLNAAGVVSLKIKHKKLCGRILETPKKRARDKKRHTPHRLPIGMLHRQCVAGLIQRTQSKAVWRVMLWLAFNCDQTTGEINVEIRPTELAEHCGLHRTGVERAIDFIGNDAYGFASIGRDYIITGRMEYVAMGKAFLKRNATLKKEKAAADKKDRRGNGHTYSDIEMWLYKFFGINAKGFMKNVLVDAYKKLVEPYIPKPNTAEKPSAPKRTETARTQNLATLLGSL